jgi:hypothetical protein
MTANINNITPFSVLPDQEKKACEKLLKIDNKLSAKCNEIENLDQKISELSVRIEETDFEAKNKRSLGTRIGYGFAGAAMIFLTPISWGIGTLVGLLSSFTLFTYTPFMEALFVKPVELCGKLFAEAMRTKEDCEKELEQLKIDKENLLTDRITEMDKINELVSNQSEPLEGVSKISLTSFKIDLASAQLMQNIAELKSKAETLRDRASQLKPKSNESKIEI